MRLHSKRRREILPKLIARDGRNCFWCGVETSDRQLLWNGQQNPLALTVDHVLELYRGGTNAMENLVISCGSCNWKRGAEMERKYIYSLEPVTEQAA